MSRASTLACLVLSALTASAAIAQHPLDPLTAAEITRATAILSGAPEWPAGAQFVTMVAQEPPKNDVLTYTVGVPVKRQAFAVILDPRGNRTYEAVANLTTSQVVSFNEIKGVQPLVLAGEYEEVSRLVKADPQWQAAMRRRRLHPDSVQIDAWAAGNVPFAQRGQRVLRALSYYKGSQVNFYGRPIEGVVVLVNMTAGTVASVVDSGVLPLPPPSQELDEASTGVRDAPKPLVITQPNGASFTINGHEISWQKWKFRYSMHPREGLVLHTVRYEDGGTERSILYRASLSEMVVPYGDADGNWRWRAAFDVGEYSVGRLASSIEANTDAPSYATLLDATFANDDGTPYTLKQAVALYERDGGMLWKHYDGYSTKNESRRSRQLVMFFIATIGNYDYAINYVFNQDGVIEVDAALSGIMLPKGVRETTATSHGTSSPSFVSGHLVAPNVVAPHHQHFFSFRLDFDVDGTRNTVTEMNTFPIPREPNNLWENGMVMRETVLGSENGAGRLMDMSSARTWSVVNTSKRTALGHNPSYIIVPGANSVPYVARTSPVRQRAAFINNHFWATRFNAAELSAAGDYPNQSVADNGLSKFVANNESLVNEDVVVWYTLGITHIPRPEEWPVMPVTHVGFKLIPGGFFTRNPALDVPKDKP